jgi:HK97 family phage prohead protease
MNKFELLFPFQKDATGGRLRIFGGIASSTAIDRDTERMDKSVLPKIADGLRKNSTVFFNHDTKGLGVGFVKSSEVRGDTVYVDVVPTQALGMQDVITQINEGLLKSFSIGGKVLDWENKFDEKLGKNVRIIKDVDIYEVSVVGIPANPDATISECIAKSFEPNKKEEAGEMNTETDKQTEKVVSTPEQPKKEAAKEPTKETPAHEGKETPSEEQGEHGGKPTGVLDKYLMKCGHCNKVIDKCASCGSPLAIEGAPKTHGDLASMTLSVKTEFDGMIQKAVAEMDSKVQTRVDAIEKSYQAREEVLKTGFEKQITVANARIEELHKTLDSRSKAMPASEENASEKQIEKGKSSEAQSGFIKVVKTYE